MASSEPGSAREALAMIGARFAWLADADLASVPASVHAECLRELERAKSVEAVAHAAVLGAFDASLGYEDDGCRSARTWLMWQTRVTPVTASASMAWVRRLRTHPAVAQALRQAAVSVSWGRQICDWTDALPDTARGDADTILVRAAASSGTWPSSTSS